MPNATGKTKSSSSARRGDFPCPNCDKTFTRQEYVRRHSLLVHEGARPHTCKACNKGFARSDLLNRHQKSCAQVKEESGAGVGQAQSPTAGPSSQKITVSAPLPLPAYPIVSLPTSLPTSHQPQPPLQNYQSLPQEVPVLSSAIPLPPSIPSQGPYNPAGLNEWSPLSNSTSSLTNSPETPFTLTDVPTFQYAEGRDSTLAPGLSRSLSQDEITASQVLEDLLGSPKLNSDPSPSYYGNPDQVSSAHRSQSNMWTGALSPRIDSSALLGSNPWNDTLFDGAGNGIENSPAAILLSDYFNKGNTGGITALDLGFKYEPSLYPEELLSYNPIISSEEDLKFHLPKDRFCLAYMQPWKVPSLEQLEGFGRKAAEKVLTNVPVVHRGTMRMSDLPIHTAFALTVAGAAHTDSGASFSNDMLVEKRVFLVRAFNKEELGFEDRFSTLQSMLLYQLLGIFHADEQHRLLSQTFHGSMVSMMRQLALPQRIRYSFSLTPGFHMSPAALDRAWKDWIKVETWRRVAFICFLCDIEIASMFGLPPFFAFSDIDIDLPMSEALWNANSASEWLLLITSPTESAPVNFVAATQALMLTYEPQPHDKHGTVLSELARLDQFPLVILSRCLSFLQQKTEEALARFDPFQLLFGGSNASEQSATDEKDKRDLLHKIAIGRERLRRMPGGESRAGGESWFKEAMPQAAAAHANANATRRGSPGSSASPSGSTGQSGSYPAPDNSSIPFSSNAQPQSQCFNAPMHSDSRPTDTGSNAPPQQHHHDLFSEKELRAARTTTLELKKLRERRASQLAQECPNFFMPLPSEPAGLYGDPGLGQGHAQGHEQGQGPGSIMSTSGQF